MGDETFTGNGEGDHFDGGSGINTIDYSAYDEAIWLHLDSGFVRQRADESTNIDTLNNVTKIIGTEQGDKLWGDENVNYIYGGGGDDEIHGYGAIDYLFGELGRDTIRGALATIRSMVVKEVIGSTVMMIMTRSSEDTATTVTTSMVATELTH